ncbi:MAG: hypothetical protein AAF742_08495 [Pseudomonadota bacterium]
MMKFIASDRAAAEQKARRAFGRRLVVLSVRDLPSGDVELSASDNQNDALTLKNGDQATASSALDSDEMYSEPVPPPPGSFGERARNTDEEDLARAAMSAKANTSKSQKRGLFGAFRRDKKTAASEDKSPKSGALDEDAIPSFLLDDPLDDQSSDHSHRDQSSDRRDRLGSRLSEPIERQFTEDNLARASQGITHGHHRHVHSASPDQPPVDTVTPNAKHDPVAVALADHGVSEALATAVFQGAKDARIDNPSVRFEAGLSNAFQFAPIDVVGARTTIMLVGPTGAGKTSCGAKFAARAIGETGNAFLMSADVGRAGAIEQLQTYSDTLGADYYVVETPQEAERTLKAARPSGTILFDTPGISPFDAGDLAALRSFQEATHAEPVLVLPASGDMLEYDDWATAFAEFGVRRMILTKFDATKRVGAGLSAAYSAGLSLAQFSETPFISEGLIDASPEFLSKRLLAARPGRIVVSN